MTNSNTSNKSLSRISSENHKRTQQEVSAELLSYILLHFYCIFYLKVYVSSMSHYLDFSSL